MDPLNPQADYSVPKSESKYLKFEEGATEFMPADSAVIGWEYWSTENKPVRLAIKPEEAPTDIRIDPKTNKPEAIKHFWAFPVIDCSTGDLKILEITQKTVQKAIRALATNPRWGSPVRRYTITVTRDDSTTPTSYTIMPNPMATVPAEWLATWENAKAKGFDINRLFRNGDPFTPDVNDPIPETVAPVVAPAAPEVTEVPMREEQVDTATPPN